MKLLKQRLINYLNYTNIYEYSSDTKTKKAPQTGALPSSIIYHLYSTYPTHQRSIAFSKFRGIDSQHQAKQAMA